MTVRWRGFPLHPETPEDGRSLSELFRTSEQQIQRMVARLRSTAISLGLPFGERTMTYNSRKAQELGLWAQSLGKGDAFHNLAFRAYFADGRNLARLETLLELAEAAGLDPVSAKQVIAEGSWNKAVDRDWMLARELNIRAVPTLVIGKRQLVGAQPFQKIAQFIEEAGTVRKTQG